MQTNRRWLNYDTFKVIIAVILLILLLLVVPRSIVQPPSLTQANAPAPAPVQPDIPQELRAGLPQGYQVLQTSAGEWVIRSASGEWLYLWDASMKQWMAVPTPVPLHATAVPVEPTPVPTEPPTAVPTAAPTATQAPTAVPPTATALPPEPTAPAPTQAAAAPTSAPQPEAPQCSALAPARLEVGKPARVTSNLNLRSAPTIGDNIVRVSLAGTTLKIIGGPQCVPYGNGAYRWWQVEAPDGVQGWSAEATLNGGMYFLELLP